MNILIVNLGSTSFKYRLFAMSAASAEPLAKGGYERVTNYGEAIQQMLDALAEAGLYENGRGIDAVGFKTVLGYRLSGCVPADDAVLDALDGFREVAPAHNPVYAEGIRAFRERLPEVPRIALFETAFYQWVDEASAAYALPKAWRDLGIRRYGFHGASHKFIAERTAELLGNEPVAERVRQLYRRGPGNYDGQPLRVLSCHLGGSSSITGIRNGIAIGTSMGFSPQSGLPQNNRVGDLDSMALPFACKQLGLSIQDAERVLTKESGLLGLSGVGNDLRDIREAAAADNADAAFAIDVLINSIQHWLGAFFFRLGGADVLVFTGGIGENDVSLRARVCAALAPFGLELDADANHRAVGGHEGCITTPGSAIAAYVVPANEEVVIAREVFRALA